MIQVADNFNYRGKKPNFDRDSFDTLQDMKNYSENSLDDGHISYCKETNKHYKFNSNNPNLIVSKGNNHSIFENKSSDPTLNYMQCGDIKATQNAPIIKNTLGEFNRLQIVKTSQQKKQSEALNHYTFDGTSVFDTDNIKPTWVYKETWYDSNGNPAYAEKTGTQYQRPANVKMGFYYFDTSLNKPIWKNSDTENVWIDATGATV